MSTHSPVYVLGGQGRGGAAGRCDFILRHGCAHPQLSFILVPPLLPSQFHPQAILTQRVGHQPEVCWSSRHVELLEKGFTSLETRRATKRGSLLLCVCSEAAVAVDCSNAGVICWPPRWKTLGGRTAFIRRERNSNAIKPQIRSLVGFCVDALSSAS